MSLLAQKFYNEHNDPDDNNKNDTFKFENEEKWCYP